MNHLSMKLLVNESIGIQVRYCSSDPILIPEGQASLLTLQLGQYNNYILVQELQIGTHKFKSGLRFRIRIQPDPDQDPDSDVFLESGSGSGIIIPDPDTTNIKTNKKNVYRKLLIKVLILENLNKSEGGLNEEIFEI